MVIVDIKMPNTCMECCFCQNMHNVCICRVMKDNVVGDISYTSHNRNKDCPIKEIDDSVIDAMLKDVQSTK